MSQSAKELIKLPENSLFSTLLPNEHVTAPDFEPEEQEDIIRVTLTQPEAYFDETGEERINLSEGTLDVNDHGATAEGSAVQEDAIKLSQFGKSKQSELIDEDTVFAEAIAFAKETQDRTMR
jgi:hypothetical protein